ncbi:MAG: TatD family hydrolase [Acidobacteria bacterium]|nr:TatD family hydrolase [Acidobacteriota bacterium]
MLVDSHCHIEGPEFDEDRLEVLARAEAAGIVRMLCIGTGDWKRRSMQEAIRLAEQSERVDTSVGVHPHDAGWYDNSVEAEVLRLVRHPKVVGWGEIGLDYHTLHADRETQLRVFQRQLALAYQWRLPVIVHSRKAGEDTLRLLTQARRLSNAGVMHCYGGGWEMARACLDLGFFISFAGNVTFKNATDLQEVARRVPADRLLVETDSPYLAPVPVRGRRNEPVYLRHVTRFLSELRREPCARLEQASAENYFLLFKSGREPEP